MNILILRSSESLLYTMQQTLMDKTRIYFEPRHEKPDFVVSDQVRLKPACAATLTS